MYELRYQCRVCPIEQNIPRHLARFARSSLRTGCAFRSGESPSRFRPSLRALFWEARLCLLPGPGIRRHIRVFCCDDMKLTVERVCLYHWGSWLRRSNVRRNAPCDEANRRLRERDQQVTCLHFGLQGYDELFDDALGRSANDGLHLHGFEREQRSAGLDARPRSDVNGDDDAWH